MTNFTIHESDWTKEFYGNYDNIKQDFLDGMRVKDIKSKYGLTDNRWSVYRRELIEEGIIQPRKKGEGNGSYHPRNYSFNHGFYQVQKWKNGKVIHVGSFRKEKDAKKCVKLMRECDWDVNQIPRVKKEVIS